MGITAGFSRDKTTAQSWGKPQAHSRHGQPSSEEIVESRPAMGHRAQLPTGAFPGKNVQTAGAGPAVPG